MAAVANVSVNLDATGVVQRLKAIQQSSVAAANGFKELSARANAVKSIVEAQQGGFAKASTVQGVFAAKVKNTEQAIRSQIEALRQIQSQVQLGGALYKKAQQQIQQYEQVLRQAKGATDGLGNSSQTSAGKLAGLRQAVAGLALQFTSAVAIVKVFTDSLNVAFARGTAEQKLKNFTGSAEEYSAALALAADSSRKFGVTQTEATQALGDIYSRLKGLGFGLKETGEIYQGFNAIALQSGTNAEDAAGAFFQLSQALGSGKLQGDELRSILERMPTLAQRLADSMGRSASEIRSMGAAGELTSQVIYKALSEAAKASGDLGNKLTEQQKTMMRLRQEADNLLNSIGKVFAPIVIAGAQQLSNAMRILGGFIAQMREPLGGINQLFLYLVQNAKTLVQIAVGFSAAVFTFKALGAATQIWAKATAALATAKKAAAAAAAVLQAIINPASIAKTVAAVAAGAGVYYALGKVIDGAASKAEKLASEQGKTQTEALKTVDSFSKLPPPLVDAKDATKQLTKELENSKAAAQDLENALNFAAAAAEHELKVVKTINDLKIQLNNLEIQRLEHTLKITKNLQDQIKIIRAVRDLEIQNAKITYESTKGEIKLQRELARIELSRQYVRQKNLEIDLKIARAKGEEVDNFIAAYNAGVDAIELAHKNLELVEEVADMQLKVAEQTYLAAIRQAKYKAEMAEAAAIAADLERRTKGVADAANEAANASERMRKATEWVVLSKEKDPSKPGYSAERINEKGQLETMRTYRPFPGGAVILGKGGYVDTATPAIVGEKGGEYIIPTGKVDGFIENYLSGARGRSAVPNGSSGGFSGSINIQTGPVMQQEGNSYVTLGDMENALQTLAATLLTNGRTTGGRRFQGV